MTDSRVRTHEVIREINENQLDRVPLVGGNTIGTLLYHIAAIELDWLYSEILVKEFPADCGPWFPHDVRGPDRKLTPVLGEAVKHHLDRLGYVRAQLVDALSTMSLPEFQRVRQLEAYDVTPEWVVHHLLQHEAEHRGQIKLLSL